MIRTVHGIIHGKTIELDEDLGVAEGQAVEVQVKVVPAAPPAKWGEGIARCAGALANEWTEEDDQIFDQIYQDRKQETRREISE
jgi:hypothetical protein